MAEHQARIAELQAEMQRLQQREALYYSLYLAMTEGVVLHELIANASGEPVDYRVLEVNPAFEAITSISQTQAAGQLASSLYGTGEPPYLDIYSQVVASGQPHTFETMFPPLEKHLRITAFAFAPGRFATVFADITEHKQTEQALRESEMRYRIATELASDYAYALRVEPDGAMIYEWVTDAFTRITGYTVDNLKLSDNVSRLVSEFIHPDDIPVFEQRQQRLLAGQSDTGEFRIRISSGDFRWLRDHAQPVWDEQQGQVVQIYGAARDITERKQAEEALRESEARYRAVSELTSDFAFLLRVEPNGFPRQEWITDAFTRITGLTLEDAEDAEKMRNIVHPDDFERLAQHQAKVLSGLNPGLIEFRIFRQDEVRWLRHYFKPVWDEQQGRVVQIYGAAQDITERKQVVEELTIFKSLVEHATDGIVLMAPDTSIVYANAAAADMFGTTPNMLIGIESMQLLNPNMRQQFRDEIIPALRTYDNWQGETWTQRLDGTYWLSFSSIIALRDEHGEVCHIATIFRDVTEQRNTEEQLQLTRFALDHAPDGVAFLNSEGQHLYANHMLCHKLGYEQDELMKLRVMDIDPALSLLMWQYMWESVKHHGANVFEGMHYCKDGTNFPVEIAFAYLEFRGSAYLCSFARDISERKAYEQQITRLAFVDPLTGLANRRRLYDAGDKAVAEARTPGSVALLYLDLDRFKAFNDTLGHDAGDELLVQVTERLQQGSRSIGMLSRIGGDEFAVLLTNTNTEQALDYARHILNQLHQPFELRGHQVYLGGSIGIAFGPLVGQPFSVLLTHADIAMYSAKRSGTGVQVYDPAISPLSPEWLQLEADLRHALQHNGLMLHYQPIMDIKLQRLLAVEALVRWPHPQRGMLSPGIFLPLAEEVGMLATLDAWVLRAALSQVAAWQALGQSITVTVNLTAPSLQKADLVEHVGYLLDLLNVPAERLVIELTEHTALRDLSLTDQVMRGLQALGVRIALDDFGTGYASLTHLRDLPIDMLKVERAFAAGIGSNTKDEAVLRAVLALGHGLEMTVIAEGIEETVQLGWLRDAGCRHVQGFLLGRPVPPEHFSNGYQLPYLPLR